MQKISDLPELENLKNQLDKADEIDKKATVEFNTAHPYPRESVFENFRSTFWGPGKAVKEWGDAQTKHRMAARFAAFPNAIEVSPAIARFLYTVYNEDTKKLEGLQASDRDTEDLTQVMFKTPIAAALAILFPNPYSAAELAVEGAKTAKSFANMVEYNRKLTKIIDERNAVVASILGNYRLMESEPGKYILQLQEFEDRSRAVSTGRTFEVVSWKEVPNAGVDPNLNPQNLPPLPPVPGIAR